jgi:hypothetical protein
MRDYKTKMTRVRRPRVSWVRVDEEIIGAKRDLRTLFIMFGVLAGFLILMAVRFFSP